MFQIVVVPGEIKVNTVLQKRFPPVWKLGALLMASVGIERIVREDDDPVFLWVGVESIEFCLEKSFALLLPRTKIAIQLYDGYQGCLRCRQINAVVRVRELAIDSPPGAAALIGVFSRVCPLRLCFFPR